MNKEDLEQLAEHKAIMIYGEPEYPAQQNTIDSYKDAFIAGFLAGRDAAAEIAFKHYQDLKDKEPFEFIAYQYMQEIKNLAEDSALGEE